MEATPKGKGICPCCDSETIAKCGTYKIGHWAHKAKIQCDPWLKKETPWHLQWKDYFPKECQEVVHKNVITGEKHIADVKTKQGRVLEFQNSPISLEEKTSREVFYPKMVWIVNAIKFRKNLILKERLNDRSNGDFERYQFTWRRSKAKQLWLCANMPVCFDFQKYNLWWLEDYDNQSDQGTLASVRKKIFITKNGGIWTEPTIEYPQTWR